LNDDLDYPPPKRNVLCVGGPAHGEIVPDTGDFYNTQDRAFVRFRIGDKPRKQDLVRSVRYRKQAYVAGGWRYYVYIMGDVTIEDVVNTAKSKGYF
jgi:hypothetical protein